MMRIRTVFSGVAGTPWYSNLYFQDESGESNVDAEAATDAVQAMWTSMAPAISNFIDWVVQPEVAVVEIESGDLISVLNGGGASGGGTATDTPLPWATQGLIRWNTGIYVGGRQIAGKMFVPGATELHNTDGNPTNAYFGIVGAAAFVLSEVASPELVVWSRKNARAEAVTAVGSSPKWAVLRTRRD